MDDLYTNSSNQSLYERFQHATKWAENKPFYRSSFGVSLTTRWMALVSEHEDFFQAVMSPKSSSSWVLLDMMVTLANEYDIDIARPYINIGIRDIDVIRRAIREGIDPELLNALVV